MNSVKEVYEYHLSKNKVMVPARRAEIIRKINLVGRSKEDSTDLTAKIIAVIAYHFTGDKAIDDYPKGHKRMTGGKIYYPVSIMCDELLESINTIIEMEKC